MRKGGRRAGVGTGAVEAIIGKERNETVKGKDGVRLNGTTLTSVNMQSVQLPQVTEFKYLGSTLQGDGDLSTEVTRGRSVDGTTGGKCQASYAIREYHHMLNEISTI